MYVTWRKLRKKKQKKSSVVRNSVFFMSLQGEALYNDCLNFWAKVMIKVQKKDKHTLRHFKMTVHLDAYICMYTYVN